MSEPRKVPEPMSEPATPDPDGTATGSGSPDAPAGGSGPSEAPATGPGSPAAPGPAAGTPDAAVSGLRNPRAAARGAAAGALVAETVVLLLAVVPLARLGARATGVAVALVLVLAVVCVVLVGLLRHRWAWYAAIAPQVALIAAGWLHLALAVVGALFLLVWLYMLNVRRTVLAPPRRTGPPPEARAR